jgi:hypothetical protein
MNRAKCTSGVVMVISVFLISAGSAAAEFTSQEKATSGKGRFAEFRLEAGGGVVKCEAYAETASVAGWVIDNSEGKASEKGPKLKVNTEKWGECAGETGGLAGEVAEVSGCELEVAEVKEEVADTASLVSTCTVKTKACTITLEHKENEKLTSVDTYPSGEETKDNDVVLEPAITNAATKVSSGCGSVGVNATGAGHITGVADMKEVQAARAIEFIATATRINYAGAGFNTGEVIVVRWAAGEGKPTVTLASTPANAFKFPMELQRTTCEMKPFKNMFETWKPIDIEYNKPLRGGARGDVLVAGPNHDGWILFLKGT